ncbi:MAG: hypothetical protein JWQ27_798 [Ferruginibacter sp.]|nr:hypothetical protein [Ferruginibacter sp.]
MCRGSGILKIYKYRNRHINAGSCANANSGYLMLSVSLMQISVGITGLKKFFA